MLTKQWISREIILLFFLMCCLWTHFSIILPYRNNIKNKDCSFNADDLFLGILVTECIGTISLSISFIFAGIILINFDEIDIINKLHNVRFFQALTIILFLVASILSNVAFFRSDYIEGKFETCSNIDAEIAFRIYTFSFAWILFFFYAYIAVGIIFILFITIGIAAKESNLFNCITIKKCFGFFCSCRKVSPIQIKSQNEKNIQTECEISIPISSLKNDIKPFTCIICMTSMIDIMIKPCNHICMCNDCLKKLSKKECPCCSKEIKEVSNIYVCNLYNAGNNLS